MEADPAALEEAFGAQQLDQGEGMNKGTIKVALAGAVAALAYAFVSKR